MNIEKVLQAREAVRLGRYDRNEVIDRTINIVHARLREMAARLDRARQQLRGEAGRTSNFWNDCED